MDTHKLSKKARRAVVLALVIVIGVGSVSAGLLITTGSGITMTGLDGITYAGENGLTNRKMAAPWAPGREQTLGWHLLQMVQHLERHKSQLFYYLKLQGKPVDTGDLWG